MKQIELKKLPVGEFFRLRDNDNASLWIRDEYNRSTRKFAAYKADNVNCWSEFSGSRVVYVED